MFISGAIDSLAFKWKKIARNIPLESEVLVILPPPFYKESFYGMPDTPYLTVILQRILEYRWE